MIHKTILPVIVPDIFMIKSIYKHISRKMSGYPSLFFFFNLPKMTRQSELTKKKKKKKKEKKMLRVKSVQIIRWQLKPSSLDINII